MAQGNVVFTKDGCTFCDQAKDLLRTRGLAFTEVPLDSVYALKSELLKRGVNPDLVASFPQVFLDYAHVGGFTQLRDRLDEPLLQLNPLRFTPFPIQHHDLYAMYKKAVASFWTVEEVDLSKDKADWETLTDEERHFVKYVLAFFANSDGIVNENLAQNFNNEVQVPEARLFYSYQIFNESIHSEMYGLLIDSLVSDPAEKVHLFNAIKTVPCVKKKADWACKWIAPTRPFAERLLAFICVEGLLFSGSFCAIFWLKKRGLMKALSTSNDFISRDEGLHQEFGTLLYTRYLKHKLSQEVAEAIVREAVEHETEFIVQALPCSLIGMNKDLMTQYIRFVADRILASVGHAKVYHCTNPFDWMETICLAGKENFFELRVSSYSKANVTSDPTGKVFALDDEF